MPLTSINFGPAEADLAHKGERRARAFFSGEKMSVGLSVQTDRRKKLANEFACMFVPVGDEGPSSHLTQVQTVGEIVPPPLTKGR